MSKRWISVTLLALMLLLPVGSTVLAAAPSQDTVTYTVQRGDTLYSIARRHGVSLWDIVSANGITNPNLIYPGQKLTISGSGATAPTPSTPSTPSTGSGIHIVARGETLTRIALKYGVSVWAIVNANGIANPNLIHPGQQLTIPGAGSSNAGDDVTPPNAPPPAGPSPDAGGFEIGGQTHSLAHPGEMNHAGMRWVKFQVKWTPGMTGSDVAARIQQAHSAGFKVLLSIVGGQEYPSSIDYSGYTAFIRQVAQQGPDAIEVWNEENIDREWPAGQINASTYVQRILAPAYQAIKAVNSNIMVISGAPAPTGYFGGGCTTVGCDDAPYIARMASAGAASYADCIGVHYNEGILPPSQTSGDPRGSSSHYTRYFWGMVNTYYNAFGGRRPVCLTELGYLSPEGYGALPSTFAWAADTSVGEHAAWLAEAAQLSASSGKVRMLIVYNVDFTLWSNADPQAGYAIIRPGGSCPACDALHNVMR